MTKSLPPTWIIHGVLEDEGIVYHTHGLDAYGSKELELNLPLEQKVAQHFLNLIGAEIANGRNFTDQEVVDDLFNVPIVFREVVGIHSENQELHLRVIFPDVNDKFPWDAGCQPAYASQI